MDLIGSMVESRAIFGVKRTICFDPHPSQEEISLTETVESRAQLSISSGKEKHFDRLVWTTHGIACSVRECGRHEGFRPGLLPHLLSRLLLIKPYSPKESPENWGRITTVSTCSCRAFGTDQQCTRKILSRYSRNQDAEGN